MEENNQSRPDVSVIIPIHNGSEWIDECMDSIINQTAFSHLSIEVSVFNDASNDGSEDLLKAWRDTFERNNIVFILNHSDAKTPGGVGFAKNQAVKYSNGFLLCFQDVDDVMEPDRIIFQYRAAKNNLNAIVGSQFKRCPEDSTLRYTNWANHLNKEQLYLQIYTSHGPTLIMPTWFCSRDVFDRVGGFSEEGRGTPEDLIFFYRHLDLGGNLFKVDKCLLLYRYHAKATTFSIDEMTIWRIRLKRFQEKVLKKWEKFTIWNAGKLGRKLYRSLDPLNQNKVIMFCDVDPNKIGKTYTPYNRGSECNKSIPVVHFSEAQTPFVICVKLGLTSGCFEENLSSLHLTEGKDYMYF